MSSKDNILSRINLGIAGRMGADMAEEYSMPDIDFTPTEYADPVAQFIKACETVSGAKVVRVTDMAKLPSPTARGNSSTVQGAIAVAENGCIWIPQTEPDRTYLFKSEHLDIIVHADSIVSNMHQAYALIDAGSRSGRYFSQYKFCTFISGPSKTADIEGALVYGAQAARSVTVYIV